MCTARLRVAEFYAGVGGLHYALLEALRRKDGEGGACDVAAFDLSPHACATYEHNFGRRPREGNVQKLSAEELDALQASLWLLSPPCQPYTRQGLQRDKADGRAESFLVIIERLREMRSPPTHLLVENVVGFERSETHVELLESLASLGYAAQGAVLSPTEVGVPYSRPRYFVLAKRAPLAFASEPPQRDADGFGVWREPPTQPPWHHEQYAAPGPLAGYLESEEPSDDAFHFVHESVLRKHGVVLDFVNADDRKCCCVTKNYFKFLRGTGSLVATQGSPKEVRWGVHMHSRVQGPVDAALLEAGSKAPLGEQTVRDLLALKPRYFTPREVANLHSFPPGFSFPPYITLKQRYALLGNSLSVAVLAPLIRYLLWDDHGRPPSEGVLIRAAGRSMGRGVFATRAFRKGELVLDDEEPMLRQEPLGEEGGTFDTSLRQAAEALGERNTAVACQVMAQLKAFHAIDEHVRNDILTELECGVPDEGRSHPLWRFCEAAADAYVATAAAHGGSSDAPAGLAPRPTHLAKAALAFALNAHDVGAGEGPEGGQAAAPSDEGGDGGRQSGEAAEGGAPAAQAESTKEEDELMRPFKVYKGWGGGALPDGRLARADPVILPDPRDDATLFADKEIEEGPARDKHLRQERRKRLGGGEGGPPPPLEEGQNYWVERLKRNNKPIPYGQGIVDDWMQHELDEISTEQYGDLHDFQRRVHDEERDANFWGLYNKAVGEVRGQAWEAIKAMQEQETAKKVPNRKLRYTLRKIAEMEVTWSNVIAAKIDGTAHPMAKKVSAEFSVDSAVEVFELTPEQELRLVELAGARHNPKLRTIRIVSTRYRYREQNQRDIARVLSRLIDEAKRAKPLSEGESPPGEGVGHQRQQLTSEAEASRAEALEAWYEHVRGAAPVGADTEIGPNQAKGEADLLGANARTSEASAAEK